MASAVLLLLVLVFAGCASGFVRLACALGDEGWRPPALVAALAAGAAMVLAGLCLMAGVDAARAQGCELGAYGCGHAENHGVYEQWKVPGSTTSSCCSDKDCRPTRAKLDDEGRWLAWNGRMWLIVPPDRVLPIDYAGDSRSHLCERDGFVYCFVPGPILR